MVIFNSYFDITREYHVLSKSTLRTRLFCESASPSARDSARDSAAQGARGIAKKGVGFLWKSKKCVGFCCFLLNVFVAIFFIQNYGQCVALHCLGNWGQVIFWADELRLPVDGSRLGPVQLQGLQGRTNELHDGCNMVQPQTGLFFLRSCGRIGLI